MEQLGQSASQTLGVAAVERGARNLLVDCVGVEAGQDILIVSEADDDYFDPAVGQTVTSMARALGAEVRCIRSPLLKGPAAFPDALVTAMEQADHTIFLSRIGDQMRFRDLPGPGSKTMVYALDAGLLGGEFATTPHGLMCDLLVRLEAELETAEEWHMTCPLGTDVRGRFARGQQEAVEDLDFAVNLFPVTIHRPVACRAVQGRVVLEHPLVPTGTHIYEPFALMLDSPVTVIVEDGRIVGFDGDVEVTARVREHYQKVAGEFGLDPYVVHSWHSGINPKTFYGDRRHDDLERWSNVAYASPRYTHFHTCGDVCPGEIAWTLIDASITVDGVPYWQDGEFVFLRRPEIRALLAAYPGTEGAFDMRWDIGV